MISLYTSVIRREENRFRGGESEKGEDFQNSWRSHFWRSSTDKLFESQLHKYFLITYTWTMEDDSEQNLHESLDSCFEKHHVIALTTKSDIDTFFRNKMYVPTIVRQ